MKQSMRTHIIWFVATLLVCTGLFIIADKATAVEPAAPQVTQAETVPIILVDPDMWATQMHAWFEAYDIHHSTGRLLPKKMYRKISHYAIQMADNGIKVKRWWGSDSYKRALWRSACAVVGGGGIPVDCLIPGKRGFGLAQEIVKVKVICGGAAVIAFFGNGGWAGAGRGAVACAWGRWAAKAFD